MRKVGWIAAASVWVCASVAAGQQKTEKLANPAHLEMTMEIAATTEEGYPSVLRVTIKNVGNVAVDMPMPETYCLPRGGSIDVNIAWSSEDPERTGLGWGRACGQSAPPHLIDQVSRDWIRLQPGEFITMSQGIRDFYRNLDRGTVEYWVEYVPPEVSAKELAELQQTGYIVPTKKIETAHQTFAIR
jgi:hypothetical protein